MAISTAPGSVLPRLRGELECPPDQWQFGLDSREVMLARTSQAVTGDLSGTEARRMVLEKQLAAIRGQLAYTRSCGAILIGRKAPFDPARYVTC